jgi:hypothetical protein
VRTQLQEWLKVEVRDSSYSEYSPLSKAGRSHQAQGGGRRVADNILQPTSPPLTHGLVPACNIIGCIGWKDLKVLVKQPRVGSCLPLKSPLSPPLAQKEYISSILSRVCFWGDLRGLPDPIPGSLRPNPEISKDNPDPGGVFCRLCKFMRRFYFHLLYIYFCNIIIYSIFHLYMEVTILEVCITGNPKP